MIGITPFILHTHHTHERVLGAVLIILATFLIQVLVCPLFFGLGRGWTPSRGGGKSYNYQMNYNVTVFYTRVHYSLTGGVAMQMRRIEKKVGIAHTAFVDFKKRCI